jgi:hypothetical protein
MSEVTANLEDTIGKASVKFHDAIQSAKQKVFGSLSETVDYNREMLIGTQETVKSLQQEISEDLNATHEQQSCETIDEESDSDGPRAPNSPHFVSVVTQPPQNDNVPQMLIADSDDSTQSSHDICRSDATVASQMTPSELNMWEWSDEDEGEFGDNLNSADSDEEVESEVSTHYAIFIGIK